MSFATPLFRNQYEWANPEEMEYSIRKKSMWQKRLENEHSIDQHKSETDQFDHQDQRKYSSSTSANVRKEMKETRSNSLVALLKRIAHVEADQKSM